MYEIKDDELYAAGHWDDPRDDPYVAEIAEWLDREAARAEVFRGTKNTSRVPMKNRAYAITEILTCGLNIAPLKQTEEIRAHAEKAMRVLGWQPVSIHRDGRRINVWISQEVGMEVGMDIEEIMDHARSLMGIIMAADQVERFIAEPQAIRRTALKFKLNHARSEGEKMLGDCGDTLEDLRIELERRMRNDEVLA
ncbi:MAG: hypothetical protein ACREBY_17880 [Polaromonas sp.]